MSQNFNLRWCQTNTEPMPGFESAVPVMGEMLFEISKTKGVDPKLRKFFHDQLDLWINAINKNPDQFGSKLRAAFEVEFRGDTDDWRTVEETQAITAKETIRLRLQEIIRLSQTK